MKIEKLRNNHKKEIIIGTILTVVIGGALTFRLTHSKYRVTQSIDLGSGVINYKAPDFKIMAMYQQKDGSTCTEDNCYNELTGRMPSSGYVINESKSYCTLDNVNHDNEVILKTVNGNHVFNNLKKSDKCYLYFDKYVLTASETILANIIPKKTTPTFSSVATSNEGVFETIDEEGTTYYWRGAVTNNYVKFAGFCWRIIRINGDKSIRMIYDGSTCHANGTSTTENIAVTGQKYSSAFDSSYYVGWTYSNSQRPSTTNNNGRVGDSSNAKTQTESWYNNNLKSYEGKIADGKYCNDRETATGGSTGWVSTGTTFYYAAYGRLLTNKTPTFNCANYGDVYILKVGLITADEVAFAGGIYGSENKLFYLYNGQNYWTMSPFCWISSKRANMFIVSADGYLNSDIVVSTGYGIRPVINLKSDITFSSGNGTQNTPYVVS